MDGVLGDKVCLPTTKNYTHAALVIFVTYTPRHATQTVDKLMKVQKDLFKGIDTTDKSKLVPTNSKVLLT